MRNYFAGGAGGMHILSYPLMKNHLIAWIDKAELKRRQDFFKKDCNILIDSGAFTAFTKGHKIDIIEYVDFINAFTEQWQDKVNSIYFINLDSIGNPQESWKNQEYLDKKGIKTLPVIHQWGFKEKTLEQAIKKYDFFAFGGMVGRKRKEHTIPWLNKCYNIIGKHWRKTKKMPKTHLLGVASEKILYRYPAFSCDSTRFMTVNRFGESEFLKENRLPFKGKGTHRYKNAKQYKYNYEKDQHLLDKIMEYEIKQYKIQEKKITEFWKKKGIIFNE